MEKIFKSWKYQYERRYKPGGLPKEVHIRKTKYIEANRLFETNLTRLMTQIDKGGPIVTEDREILLCYEERDNDKINHVDHDAIQEVYMNQKDRFNGDVSLDLSCHYDPPPMEMKEDPEKWYSTQFPKCVILLYLNDVTPVLHLLDNMPSG